MPTQTTVYTAIGLPSYTQLSWTDIVNRVNGKAVNFYTCGTYN